MVDLKMDSPNKDDEDSQSLSNKIHTYAPWVLGVLALFAVFGLLMKLWDKIFIIFILLALAYAVFRFVEPKLRAHKEKRLLEESAAREKAEAEAAAKAARQEAAQREAKVSNELEAMKESIKS